MSTFQELQQRVMTAKSKSAIYQHLIDHLEANFRPVAGAEAKKVLMTDDKVRVADSFFEQVVKELFTGLEAVNKEVEQIMQMPLLVPGGAPVPAPVAAPANLPAAPPNLQTGAVNISVPVPAPVPVVAAPEPKKKSSKSTTQGEAQS
jgi:hypothetical protein